MFRLFLNSYLDSDLISNRCNLIVVDYLSTDIDICSELKNYCIKSTLITCEDDFNRSIGLQRGFDNSKSDRVFFVDIDMTIPRMFSKYLFSKIIERQCISPLCYSYLDADRISGYWREWGVGNCGFMRSDFREIGGWNQSLRGYGFEDTELFIRTRKKLIIVRERLEDFSHRYHPEGIRWKTQNHSIEIKNNPIRYLIKNIRMSLSKHGPLSFFISLLSLYLQNRDIQNKFLNMKYMKISLKDFQKSIKTECIGGKNN